MKQLKVIFMGTPSFGVESLKLLIGMTNVVMVVTQPDKTIGRKKELVYSDIKKIAIENNIDVFQPNKIRNDYELIKNAKPDLIVTAAYGQILPKELLDIPRLGCLNLHGSILPKYRGASPIQSSLLNGDEKTGVTLMYMDEKMDTGDIIDTKELMINPEDNYYTLYDGLSIVAKELLNENLNSIVKEENKRIKQIDEEATYTRMFTREDELIDFNLDGKTIVNKVRGLYPNCYFVMNNEPIKVLKCRFESKKIDKSSIVKVINKKEFGITSKDGIVYLEVVKPNGKKEMLINNYINGLNKEKNIGIGVNDLNGIQHNK